MEVKGSSEDETIFGGYPEIGFVSIFYAAMEAPLSLWDKQVRRGEIRRVVDDGKDVALDLFATSNIYATYITTPKSESASLGIRLPYLVFVVKEMNKNVAFTVQIRDEVCTRRFFFCTSYKTSRIKTFSSYVPIGLNKGWNELSVDLALLTRKAYGTKYLETVRVQIHPNCRLRLVYFSIEPVDTSLAVEIMKVILTTGGSDPGGKKMKPTSSDTISPVRIPRTAASRDPIISKFIQKTVNQRRETEAAKAKSAVFGEKYLCDPEPSTSSLAEDVATADDDDDAESIVPDETKSCPQFTIEAENEIRRILEEELLRQDFENYQQNRGLEESLSQHAGVSDISLRSSQIETDIEIKPIENYRMPTFDRDARSLLPPIYEESPNQSPPAEDLTFDQTVQTTLTNNRRSADSRNGNKKELPIKDLEEQLGHLESVVQGLIESCPSVSTIAPSAHKILQRSVSCTGTSKMALLKTRIKEMKQKLKNLEQSFEFPEPDSPGSSQVHSPVSSPASATPSGILIKEPSLPKLKPKLSVRFASCIAQSDECPILDEHDVDVVSEQKELPEDPIAEEQEASITTQTFSAESLHNTADEYSPRPMTN